MFVTLTAFQLLKLQYPCLNHMIYSIMVMITVIIIIIMNQL